MLSEPTLINKHKNRDTRSYAELGNFLNNRSFQVKVRMEFSDKFKEENGTPQGSIVTPILFLIMINNFNTSRSNVDLTVFTDDRAILSAG